MNNYIEHYGENTSLETKVLEAIKDYFNEDDFYEDYEEMWIELANHIAQSI